MRETLRQLTLALALPVAVAAVWIVRAESAGAPARESAIAYRAELADLPLPTREQFRPPGGVTERRVARVTPEDPTARHRRPLLPNPSAPTPVDLAVAADSAIEVAASPSRRAAQELPDSTPSAPLPALLAAPAPIAAAPSAASHRPSFVPATDSEVPAQSTTGSAAVEPAEETRSGKSVTLEPVLGLLPRDTAPVGGGVHVPLRGWAKPPSKFSPISTAPVGSDKGRFEKPDDRVFLAPPDLAADPVFDLPLQPGVSEPPGQLDDFTLPPLEDAVTPKLDDPKPEITLAAPGFQWRPSLPMGIRTIPEPGSALLLGAALAVLGSARRRSRRD